MTCFNIDDLEKKFKKMKFLEIEKEILQYICDKNNKHEEMLKWIRDIRNKKVNFKELLFFYLLYYLFS